MTGNMVDSCHPNQLNEIGQWHKPWFFKHVEEKLHNGQDTEYIPIRDYYHRHSRYVCTSRKVPQPVETVVQTGLNYLFRHKMNSLPGQPIKTARTSSFYA